MRGHQLQLRILLRQPFFDVFDPLVLIRGAQRRGDDGKLAFVVEYSRSLVSQRVADALRRRLIDEEVARVLFGIGIPSDYFDAFIFRFA